LDFLYYGYILESILFCNTIKLFMAKLGRPPLPKRKALGRLISLRLRPEELQKINEAAERSNLKLSAWIRKVLSKAAEKQ